MSAKEMFEALGYEIECDDGCIDYIKAHCFPDRINTERIEFKNIIFTSESVIIKSYSTDALCMNKGYFDALLTMEELKAIKQQCKELGWLDE